MFSALCGLLPGQSPVPNQVFCGASEAQGLAVNQDGTAGAVLSNAGLFGGPVRLAPDGTPWSFGRTTGTTRPTAIAFRRVSPSAYQPAFVAPNLPGDATAIAVTAESRALVGTDANALVEVDRIGGGTFQTFSIAGSVTAVEVDENGRAWVGVDNTPDPVLQRIDRPSGASSLTIVPGNGAGISRIVADGRPGGSHVYVTRRGNSSLYEFDGDLRLIARHVVPEVATDSTILQVELAADGSLWLLIRAGGIWRFDRATGSFERQFPPSEVQAIGFDAHGVLWYVNPTDPILGAPVGSIDVPTGKASPTTFLRGMSGNAVMQDAGGLYIAQVLDQAGDSDGDGFANRAEIDARSNPFDPDSTPELDLQTRLDVPIGADLTVRLRGRLGVGVIAFARREAANPISLPGILGNFGLDPTTTVGEPFNVLVPGELRLRIPDGITSFPLYAQALGLPVIGPARFSDVAPIRVRASGPGRIVENFSSPTTRDDSASAGTWSNGSLRGAQLGGRGLLGEFDPTVGQLVAPDVWRFDTDNQTFPGSQTLFGSPVTVTNGVFEFETMVIPAGVTVQFRGSRPPIIKVRGDLRLEGTLDVDGASVAPGFDPRSVFDPGAGGFVGVDGNPGAAGGPGGAAGGQGGRGSDGNGQVAVATGSDGEPIHAAGASGYATVVGRAATGGRGALPFPPTGMNSSVMFRLFNAICAQIGSGGGGGAFLGAGSASQSLQATSLDAADLGPATPGGSAVPFVSQPANVSGLTHFLVGGAGGGGGGSHPTNMSTQNIQVERRAWHAGNGGAGGGGAVALRVGNELSVGASGEVSVRGGSGPLDRDRTAGPAMPGGGGSGGSILIQMLDANSLSQNGTLDVSGGAGGRIEFVQFNGQRGIAVGGDGGHGQVRLETPTTAAPSVLGRVDGPAMLGSDNAGPLVDQDAWSGSRSTWYRMSDLSVPNWERYLVQATYSGLTVTFSDDPAAGPSPNLPGQPIRFYVQGGSIDPATGTVLAAGPFRERTADLNQDAATHVRFVALFDRTIDPTTSIDRVEIVAR